MKYTKSEKILMNMYASIDRTESIEILTDLKKKLLPGPNEALTITDSVITKLKKISNQEYDQIEFLPDELITDILGCEIDELDPANLSEALKTLSAELEY